jgi:hypothetical protein
MFVKYKKKSNFYKFKIFFHKNHLIEEFIHKIFIFFQFMIFFHFFLN